MASHVLFLQLLPVLLLVHSVIGLQNVPKELAGEGVGNKAGVQARLSQKGVNYIASFLKDVLIEQVLGPSPKNNEEIQVQLNGTKSRLTDLVLTIQSGPGPLRTRTEPPRQALVELPAITFETKAKLELETGNGQIRFRVPEATLWLNVSAQQHAQGSPNFRIEKCHLRIEERKSLIVSVEAASLESDKRASMEKELIGAGPALLEQLICSRVVFILDERVNQRFALLPSKLSLAQLNGTFIVDELLRRVGARRQRRADGVSSESSAASAGAPGPDSELFASFNVSRSDSLLLDYTIVDIRADHRGIEVDSSGEVFLRGRGGTPFGPVRLALPELASEDQMLQMLVSDFMPNSLLYHGHSVGLFNARVDPGTPHFGPIMRTSCPPSSGLLFCLGDFFPTLRRVHPDRGLALLFSTVQPPVLRFRPQSAGGISFSLLGRIVISLLPPGSSHQQQHGQPSAETEVAQMQLSVDAHMKIRLSSTAVKPKVTLDKIALKTLSPGVLAQEELDKSVLLAREVLQRMVNDMLRGGIPIPVHPLLRLHKPRVKIMDRALLLLTNVEFNERLIRQITSAGLDKRTSR